jgi:hypothetical protein
MPSDVAETEGIPLWDGLDERMNRRSICRLHKKASCSFLRLETPAMAAALPAKLRPAATSGVVAAGR